ncbi:hypothetical protein V6N13_140401 [Hibiscus sabdariffa]
MPQKLTVVTCLCKYDNDVNVVLINKFLRLIFAGFKHVSQALSPFLLTDFDGNLSHNKIKTIPPSVGNQQETSMAYCPECTLLAFNFGFKFDSEALLSRKSVLLMSVAYYRR